MNLDDYEEPRVLVTYRSSLDLDYWKENYFSREEFCLVTGLRFGVEYWAEYNNKDDPIPFRRRVFSSTKDGKPIIGKMVEKLITNEFFDRLHDDNAVSLCCVGILQFVLLGLEDRRRVPGWILRLVNDRDGWDKYPWGLYVWPTLYSQLRDANVRRWPNLYATEPRRDVDKKTYSMFRFIWAFKGRLPTERLTPDENEARSDWWFRIEEQKRAVAEMLKKEAEREKAYEQMRKFMQDMSVGPGGPSSFPTQGNNSFFEGVQATPSYGHNMAMPN
ncbi:phospholipase-like protein [Tanacetum coccineum]